MKITGERTIPAAPDKVWEALNDPAILRQSIPGCKSLEPVGENAFKATVETKIGPIRAVFHGDVHLSNLDPPHGYTLTGRGSAGGMGSARGSARVRLARDAGGTKLSYDADADVTGKFAQLGSRLIQGTANLLADQFFSRFGEAVAGPEAEAGRAGIPWWIWALAGLALAAATYYLLDFRGT